MNLRNLYIHLFLTLAMFTSAHALVQTTGVVELDAVNNACKAKKISLLQNNQLSVLFEKPHQLSFIKVMYESLNCVHHVHIKSTENLYTSVQSAIVELTDAAYKSAQKALAQEAAEPAMYAFNY